ncbi:hypothetical protein BDR26DRAFT_66911 [Obelidium mucronatum]|nr:hypothetical protein BDR26DRAFT_66911 [Obelidium mucronatum]
MLSLIKATAAASAVSAMANGASPAAGSNPSNTAPLSPLQTNMMLNSSAPMSPGSPHHSHHQHTHQHLHSPHFPLKRHRAASTPSNQSPDSNSNTERDFCKDLYCCGFHLKDLHQLQLHGEMFHGGASMAALASILELRTCKAPAVLSPVPLPSKLSIELSASSLSRRSSDCSTSGVNPPSQPANEAIDIDEDMKVGFDDDETMSSIGASLSEELKLDSNMCSGDDDLTEAADFFKNAMKPIGVFESSGSSTNTGSQSLSHDPALLAAIHYVETMRISPPVPPRSKAPIAIGAMLSPVLTLPARDIDGLLSPVLALPPSHEPGILMPTMITTDFSC